MSLSNYLSSYADELAAKEKAYGNQKTLLEQRYGIAVDELDASKQRQQEIAAVTLEKLRKYLPYAVKAQGLSGTGASESTLLSADANYANTMADIAANYDTNKRALDQGLIDDKLDIEQRLEADKDAIAAKYDERAYNEKVTAEAEEKAAAKEASNTAYNSLLTQIERKIGEYVEDDEEDGLLSPEEKSGLLKYIEANGGQLSESDRANLLTYLEGYDVRSEDAQTEVNATNAAVENIYTDSTLKVHNVDNVKAGVEGDNLEIDYQGEKYDVELDSAASGQTTKILNKKFDGAPTDGACAVENNKIYIYAGGSWYSVRNRGGLNTGDWTNLIHRLSENGANIKKVVEDGESVEAFPYATRD